MGTVTLPRCFYRCAAVGNQLDLDLLGTFRILLPGKALQFCGRQDCAHDSHGCLSKNSWRTMSSAACRQWWKAVVQVAPEGPEPRWTLSEPTARAPRHRSVGTGA